MWSTLTNLGDSAVLLPLAGMLFVWLWLEGSRRLAVRWLGTFGALGAVVVSSKLAFLIGDLGVPCIKFHGFSGHTALATFSYPALAWLMFRPTQQNTKHLLGAVGLLVGALVGWSRLEVQAHTLSEVVGGFGLGALAAGLFIRGTVLPRVCTLPGQAGVIGGYLLCYQMVPAPTYAVLVSVAKLLGSSGY